MTQQQAEMAGRHGAKWLQLFLGGVCVRSEQLGHLNCSVCSPASTPHTCSSPAFQFTLLIEHRPGRYLNLQSAQNPNFKSQPPPPPLGNEQRGTLFQGQSRWQSSVHPSSMPGLVAKAILCLGLKDQIKFRQSWAGGDRPQTCPPPRMLLPRGPPACSGRGGTTMCMYVVVRWERSGAA